MKVISKAIVLRTGEEAIKWDVVYTDTTTETFYMYEGVPYSEAIDAPVQSYDYELKAMLERLAGYSDLICWEPENLDSVEYCVDLLNWKMTDVKLIELGWEDSPTHYSSCDLPLYRSK